MAGDGKKLPLTSVVVVLAAFVAGAGTGAGLHASFGGRRHPPGQHEGRGRLPPFLEALKLEPQQRTAIEAVVTKYHPRFEALFKENAPKMQALREEMDAEILPLLSESQRAQMEELKKRRPPGDGPHGFGPPPGGPGGPPPPPGEGPPRDGPPPPP